uniref:Uncharacterized protein n=1 Tax=Medicago truncatula TaxID=3880 RepID=Q2HSY0_MEDTR|nr:hypothetical protein MtrDRAFT_AC150889g22v2 [Medicago truncatula]
MKHLQWSEGAQEIHLVKKDGRKAREKRREIHIGGGIHELASKYDDIEKSEAEQKQL